MRAVSARQDLQFTLQGFNIFSTLLSMVVSGLQYTTDIVHYQEQRKSHSTPLLQNISADVKTTVIPIPQVPGTSLFNKLINK